MTLDHKTSLKGIVHPKFKFCHLLLTLVPNLYECICSEHKGIYFEDSLWSGYFGAPLTSIVGKQYCVRQWCPRTALFPTFFRISSSVFRTKTFIQVWNYLRVSKLWQDFHFGFSHIYIQIVFRIFKQIYVMKSTGLKSSCYFVFVIFKNLNLHDC